MDSYKRLKFWAISISLSLILFGILIDTYSGLRAAYSGKDFNNIPDFIVYEHNSFSALFSPTNPPPKVIKTVPVIVTAYSSTPGQTDDTPFITASGSRVRNGIVANNLLAFGTKIRIPEVYGEKIFIVEDRMSWKKGDYHFDVWFSDYNQAVAFGAKRTQVEILEL